MTFDEHLARNKRADGTYDWTAAEEARAAEIEAQLEGSPETRKAFARKAAATERRTRDTSERARHSKLFEQSQLALIVEDDLSVHFNLGESVSVELRDMNIDRTALRKDVVSTNFARQAGAFNREIRFLDTMREELSTNPEQTFGEWWEQSAG